MRSPLLMIVSSAQYILFHTLTTQLSHGFYHTFPLWMDRRRLFKPYSIFAMSVSTSPFNVDIREDKKTTVPITVLSGFLGSGKTSFLQHALENDKGAKFGLLINDMASINIDSKLIKKTTGSSFSGVDTMELQNGCVCCTLAEDLIISVSKLIELADVKKTKYDHIIVECSGIAEPRKIRELFQAAEDYGDPLTERVSLDTLVTVVDATVFLELFGTDKEIKSYTNLALSANDEKGQQEMEQGMGMRKVTELLLEQVECADTILINKVDLLTDPSHLEIVTKVVKSINPNARVLTCVRGEIDAVSVIGSAKGEGVAAWGVLDEHRKLIQAVENPIQHGEEGHVCDTTCTEATAGHSHDHAHSSSKAEHGEPGHVCTSDCVEGEAAAHSHDHSHSAEPDHVCDTTCNHDHSHDSKTSHSHDHSHDSTTAETRFGITSFVYRRRRPFHPVRLSMFLKSIGKLSVRGVFDYAEVVAGSEDKEASKQQQQAKLYGADAASLQTAKNSLLRSKGFIWMATSASGAYFISHAGQFLELSMLGRWWADIPEEEWPEEARQEITIDFEGSHGDRRQEVVFIGQFGNASGNSQTALERVLDTCLLNDEEMNSYELNYRKGDNLLRQLFFQKT